VSERASSPPAASPTPAPAPQLRRYGTPISLATVKMVREAAEAEAVRNRWPMVIAIVDSTGHLVALHRLDQAQYGSVHVALAKADPGKYGVALAGVGGVSHLTLELFKIRANINLLPVPYRGAGAAMGDIAGGTVPMIFTGVAAAKPLLDTARVRAIAVCSRKRTGSLPNVPTFEELGYSGMDAPLWIGMMAPKGTPERIIAKLDAEFRKALASPDVRERLAAQSADIVADGPREFGEMIRRDTARWREVVKTANIKID